MLEIDDEPNSNSQTLFSDHSSPSKNNNKAHMYHRYVPSYTSHLSDMRPTCSKELDENRNDEVVEVNGIRSLKSEFLVDKSNFYLFFKKMEFMYIAHLQKNLVGLNSMTRFHVQEPKVSF